jgi:hypothetical protein
MLHQYNDGERVTINRRVRHYLSSRRIAETVIPCHNGA